MPFAFVLSSPAPYQILRALTRELNPFNCLFQTSKDCALFFFFFVSRRVDTAECNAEPPHLTRMTLINGPQEGCYMHVKITRAMNPASLTNNITAQTVDFTDGHGQGQRKRARKRTEDEKQRANVTKTEELNVNEKMVINERSNDVTGTPLTDEKGTATRRTKTFEKYR